MKKLLFLILLLASVGSIKAQQIYELDKPISISITHVLVTVQDVSDSLSTIQYIYLDSAGKSLASYAYNSTVLDNATMIKLVDKNTKKDELKALSLPFDIRRKVKKSIQLNEKENSKQ